MCMYKYVCVCVLQWKPQKWQTTTITMARRNCKINGVKLAKRERVVGNRGNHKADRRGSTSSPLEDAAQSAGTRCLPFDGPRRCDSWVSPKDGTNESIDALPAACWLHDNGQQWTAQGAATAAGKVSRQDPTESEKPPENRELIDISRSRDLCFTSCWCCDCLNN